MQHYLRLIIGKGKYLVMYHHHSNINDQSIASIVRLHGHLHDVQMLHSA